MDTTHDGVIPLPEPATTSFLGPTPPHEPTIQDLERELPLVDHDQIPLGDLLSRVMQAIYAELAEMAETCVPKAFIPLTMSSFNFCQFAEHV
jgi:mediator of RNA polymerase II transcription subunit 14